MSVTCCLGYQKNGSEGMREIKEQKRKKKKAPCGAFMGSPTPALLVFFFFQQNRYELRRQSSRLYFQNIKSVQKTTIINCTSRFTVNLIAQSARPCFSSCASRILVFTYTLFSQNYLLFCFPIRLALQKYLNLQLICNFVFIPFKSSLTCFYCLIPKLRKLFHYVSFNDYCLNYSSG